MIVKKIGIIGSGVVGSATGKGFHKLGHDVLFYDIAKNRMEMLKKEGFKVAHDVKDALQQTDITFVCYNPEFLRQESAYEDFFIPDRVIIGEDIEGSSKLLQDLYKPLTEKIIVTSFKASEMIKYTANCFLSLKISFFNEIGMVCKELGIDDRAVSLGVSLDKRIGKYGTIAGRPFEGACLPKDTKALSTFIRKRGWTPDLLKVTLDINKKIEELVTKTAFTK